MDDFITKQILADKLGLGSRPEGVGVKELFIVGIIASIGLTVALFVTGQAFATDAGLERDAKLGALLSIFCGVLAVGLAKLMGVGGGESDDVLANMSRSEQFSNIFFKADRRAFIEQKALADAHFTAAESAIETNKRFATIITELHEEVRELKKRIHQLEGGNGNENGAEKKDA